jgi:hypothetical protein
MKYHVVEARHVRAHTVWLRFRDGTAGEIDLAPALRGPIMEPLKDVGFFQRFSIHPGSGRSCGRTGRTSHQSFCTKISELRPNQALEPAALKIGC